MRIAVVGGSLAGLATALILARDGHELVVLDRDDMRPAPDVEAAAKSAFRAGAPQAVHGHVYMAAGRRWLRDHLPDVYSALLDIGVHEVHLPSRMPPTLADRSPQPGDDDLTALQSRRSTVDLVFRRAAAAEPRIELQSGRAARGLLSVDHGGGIPRVIGVAVDGGELRTDLVIDAAGRRSPIAGWLTNVGSRALKVESGECGLTYYTRHYRLRPGIPLPPLNRGFAGGGPLPQLSCVLFPGDGDTAMISVAPLDKDTALKAVRHAATFEAVARSVPTVGPWLEAMDPISDVYAMGSLRNSLRRGVVDGAPVALGTHSVGDSVCTTNPAFGRGVTLALVQAAALARAIAAHPDDLRAQALALDAAVTKEVQPWYAHQVAADAERLAELSHNVFGAPLPASPSPGGPPSLADFAATATVDAVVWRAWMRTVGMLQLPSVLQDDQVMVERVRLAVAAGVTATPLIGPTREELLALTS